MSDLFSGSGLLGGLLGGLAGASSAQSNNANAGHENMTTTTQTNPYGSASPYINAILAQGWNDLGPGSAAWGQQAPQGYGIPAYGGTTGLPQPGSTPTTSYPQQPPTGLRGGSSINQTVSGGFNGEPPGGPVYADSQRVGPAAPAPAYRNSTASGSNAQPSGGGGLPQGGASGNTVGLTGVSASDEAAIQAMMNASQTMTSNPLYKSDSNYAQSFLNGGNPNSENAASFAAAQQLEQGGNPALNAYIAQLFGGQMPGSPGSQGTNPYMLQASQVGGGFGGTVQYTPQSVSPEISNEDKFIEGELGSNAYTANPAMQQEIAAATASIKNQMAQQTLPGITTSSVGSGMMGGSSWQNAMAQAANQESTNLGNTVGNLYYQDYQTQQANQMQAAQIGSQINENQASNAASMNNAAMAASASGSAAERSAALQYQLGMANLYQQGQTTRASDLENAIGLGANVQSGALNQMGSLAGAYGQQQTAAAGLAPELAMMPSNIMNEAGQLSEGASKDAVSAQSAQNQLRASLAQSSVARSAVNLQQQEFYDPLTRLNDYSNIVNNLTGRYGSSTSNTSGTNFTGTPQQSVAGQGLAGALGGMNLGNMLGGLGSQDPNLSSTNPDGSTLPPGTFYDPTTGQYYTGDPYQYSGTGNQDPNNPEGNEPPTDYGPDNTGLGGI